jgi:hypothetical protein
MHVCSLLYATCSSYLHLEMIIWSGVPTKRKYDTASYRSPISGSTVYMMDRCVCGDFSILLIFVGYVVISVYLANNTSPGAQCKCACFKFPHNLDAIIWT